MGNTRSHIPMIGNIENRFILKPARIHNSKFGNDSNLYFVIEFDIADQSNDLIDIGKIIKQKIFPDYPPFVYNVSFTSSKSSFFTGHSHYADPTSHWFNVFYGFYEFDAPCSLWKRPFGFTETGELHIVDLLKMSTADWNLLSNYIYGVPFDKCLDACTLTGEEQMTIVNNAIEIGGYTYMEVILENVMVTSAYPCHEKLLTPYPGFSEIWRQLFGTSSYTSGHDIAFPRVRMKGHFYIRYSIEFDLDFERSAYKTWVSGGTINMDYPDSEFNDQFLNAQLKAVRKCLEEQPFRKK